MYISLSFSLFQFMISSSRNSHMSPSNMKILLYFSKMSQVLPSISKVIAARHQMGSRPLAGAALNSCSSDVLKYFH